jgi:phosphotransferase system  glucose/maltose/N-acetylglucosamine-specific IIC component
MPPVRSLLLGVVFLGLLGLAAELYLLGHYFETAQWAPLVTLALAFLTGVAVAVSPRRATVRSFQAAMALAVIVGLVGIGFHLRSNYQFDVEIEPESPLGTRLFHVLHGAVPSLAPGALVQLGLVGLVFCFRHPALDPEKDLP